MVKRAVQTIPPQPPFTNSKDVGRPLRIGYISPDLREHSVAYFFEPLLAARESGGLTHHCYFTSRRADRVTAHLRSRADSWTDAATLSNADLIAKIRHDQIDILFDLGGYSAGSRPEVFAARAAPIQINFIGWAQSTGIPAMDYRLVDALTDPAGTDKHTTEQLLRLDPCFLCYKPPAAAPLPRSAPTQHSALSTQHSPTAFASFNAITKIGPAVLDAWAAILTRVPDSTLLLKAWGLEDPACGQRIAADLASRGINPVRIQTRGKTADNSSHLALYNEIDIALDTFPYNGTTTTCESLWMGVPVIGLAGDSHLSRVGLSLLTCIGLPELVAPTVDDYIHLAANLAKDPARLAAINGDPLRNRLRASPLCDQASFASRFATAMRQLWRDWCNTTP
jgi:predicted O-linked N-acetylglucosamine transferase (SPINDLY family)